MELDKRIRSIVDILTVINSDMGGIIGKTGYFGNSIMDFKRLDTCEHGELTGIIRNTDRCFEYENCADSGRQGYCYFIPEDYLLPEEPEKKYRPYTIKDFEKAFLNDEFDDFIIFRDKHNPDDIYNMRYNGNFRKGQFEYICLGAKNFSFESLFENYEVADYDGDWQPFGVLDE